MLGDYSVLYKVLPRSDRNMTPFSFSSLFALMLMASASSAPLVFKAPLSGSAIVPPVNTSATGLASITLTNSTYATGFFFATNIASMTMAHLHKGSAGTNGPVIAWAFNGTYGPISGSIKASFTFNPSVNNISTLLAAGLVYFNVHTVAHPAGELRGQLQSPTSGNTSSPPAPNSNTCPSLVGGPSKPPTGYKFYQQVTSNKKYSFACGDLNSTYMDKIMDNNVAVANACDLQPWCAGFTLYFSGVPYHDSIMSPDSYCLKLNNDPSQLVSASSTIMKTKCYGFFSKTGFAGNVTYPGTPPSPPVLSPPTPDPYAETSSHAGMKSGALSVPPSIDVPTTRGDLPLNYIFGSDEGLEGLDGKKRSLKQSIYGNNPMTHSGGPTVDGVLNCYTIWIGFEENDPFIAWTHHYLANIDTSTHYRVIREFNKSKDGSDGKLEGLVKLLGTAFLKPDGTASLAGYTSSIAVNAVVKYAIKNNLVPPADPNNLYFVFTPNGDPTVINPADENAAGWHNSETNNNGQLVYTYSFVSVPSQDAPVPYFANHDPAFSPSGDQKIDYFVDTVNHEVIETVTDPATSGGLAWYATKEPGGENGDLCNNIMLPSVQIIDDGSLSPKENYVEVPDDINLPTTSIGSIAGGDRTVAYNVMVGGWPFMLQSQYLPTINPATGRQWGCVLGIDDNGVPFKAPL